MGERVLYDKLWEIAERADWRLMTVEYEAFAVGALVIAAVHRPLRRRNLFRSA
jgi:hypothetical protein